MAFDAAWLALREQADARARDAAIMKRALRCVGSGAALLDLGCGTGATVRAFAAHGATELDWRLLDNDRDLLARAAAAHPQATTHMVDLADIDALPLEDVQLVTASALLDLVSEDWVARFAARLARARLPFYAVLSYDGQMHWDPAEPSDAEVTAAFNTHQHGDKGFGPALGPDADSTAEKIFRDHGFEVTLGQSPWQLGPQDAALHAALLDGIAEAATEAGCEAAAGWLTRRRADLGTIRAEIGHLDLLAVPRGISPGG